MKNYASFSMKKIVKNTGFKNAFLSNRQSFLGFLYIAIVDLYSYNRNRVKLITCDNFKPSKNKFVSVCSSIKLRTNVTENL